MALNLQTVLADKNNFRLGQFKAKMVALDGTTQEYVVDYPTQQELAEGWRPVLPKKSKTQPSHHFSVYLSQLPPYLWKYLHLKYDREGREHYNTVHDNIYSYTVKKTPSDEISFKLFNEVKKIIPDRQKIKSMLIDLEKDHVKGWLIVKAQSLM